MLYRGWKGKIWMCQTFLSHNPSPECKLFLWVIGILILWPTFQLLIVECFEFNFCAAFSKKKKCLWEERRLKFKYFRIISKGRLSVLGVLKDHLNFDVLLTINSLGHISLLLKNLSFIFFLLTNAKINSGNDCEFFKTYAKNKTKINPIGTNFIFCGQRSSLKHQYLYRLKLWATFYSPKKIGEFSLIV